MKKQMMFVLIPIIFIIVILSGCFGSSNNEITDDTDKFIGTWIFQGSDTWYELSDVSTITFFSEGNFTTDANANGTYAINEKSLVLTMGNGDQTLSFEYSFTDNYQRLTLTDSEGKSAAYIKET